jgi:hypothetical protein
MLYRTLIDTLTHGSLISDADDSHDVGKWVIRYEETVADIVTLTILLVDLSVLGQVVTPGERLVADSTGVRFDSRMTPLVSGKFVTSSKRPCTIGVRTLERFFTRVLPHVNLEVGGSEVDVGATFKVTREHLLFPHGLPFSSCLFSREYSVRHITRLVPG